MSKKVILSGMRPTGKLHIGHWVGALSNWVKLQEEYECFFMVADWHAVMSEYKNPAVVKDSIYDNLADWLAWGIDPDKATLFIQSDVPEHLELFMILSFITPLGWLSRCPTFKEQVQQLKEKDVNTYAFFGYPALQAADIALYKADCVPVGEDQLPHLELAREIVRRFNSLYKQDVFVEPKALLTEASRLMGLDGRKMSKSYGNVISLDENKESLNTKILAMITDPERIKKSDPGHPDICNVYAYWGVFFKSEQPAVCDWCKNAQKGCRECKTIFAQKLEELIAPKRVMKQELLNDKGRLCDILSAGKNKAQKRAREVITAAKSAMGI